MTKEDAIYEIKQLAVLSNEKNIDHITEALEMAIETLHIDIVRCKECRYCKRKRGTFKGEPIIFYRCTEHNRDVENDDFCSWGERSSE